MLYNKNTIIEVKSEMCLANAKTNEFYFSTSLETIYDLSLIVSSKLIKILYAKYPTARPSTHHICTFYSKNVS